MCLYVSVCVCSTSSLSIHLLIDRWFHTLAIIKRVDTGFWTVFSFSLDKYLEMELWDCMIFSFLRNFYTVFHSGCTIYILTNSAKGFPFLHILANTLFLLLITAILTGGFDLYLIIDIEHLSICLLTMYKASLEKSTKILW